MINCDFGIHRFKFVHCKYTICDTNLHVRAVEAGRYCYGCTLLTSYALLVVLIELRFCAVPSFLFAFERPCTGPRSPLFVRLLRVFSLAYTLFYHSFNQAQVASALRPGLSESNGVHNAPITGFSYSLHRCLFRSKRAIHTNGVTVPLCD